MRLRLEGGDLAAENSFRKAEGDGCAAQDGCSKGEGDGWAAENSGRTALSGCCMAEDSCC